MSLLATTGPPVTLLKGRSHMRRAVMRRALPRFASKNTRRVLPAQRSNARRMFERAFKTRSHRASGRPGLPSRWTTICNSQPVSAISAPSLSTFRQRLKTFVGPVP